MKNSIVFIFLVFVSLSSSAQDFLGPNDTLHILFKGHVNFEDSLYHEVNIRLENKDSIIALTSIDSSGHYQIEGKMLAQCSFIVRFYGDGFL